MKLFRNDNQTVLDEVAGKLSERLEKEVVIFSTTSMGGGCINQSFKVETNAGIFFMKWNSACKPDMFVREAESLTALKKAAGEFLVIPEVFAAKPVDSNPGFLVLEYLSPGFSAANDEKLGRGLAVLHQFRHEKFGFYHDNYCGATLQNNVWADDWATFFKDNRLGFLLRLIQNERPLPAKEVQVYEKLLLKIPDLLPTGSIPALIHGDLWSGNYWSATKGPALIDPASYFAEREMEFAIMTLFGGFSSRFYDAYNETYPLLPGWKTRNKLYQLYHTLNHYYLFGGGYQSQSFQIACYFAG
jgi:fructosamine-3-kinase